MKRPDPGAARNRAKNWARRDLVCDAGGVTLPRAWTAPLTLTAVLGVFAATACTGHHDSSADRAQRLEKEDEGDVAVPVVPVPAENGPRLGALANVTPVFDRPSRRGVQIGALHAGATVARAESPFGPPRGCEGGWFAIRPRGFVCAGPTATTNLSHPTLVAMGVAPDRAKTLPYAYARVVRDTTLFEADPARETAVRPLGALRARSGLAVVGSWNATDPAGKSLRLAMTTDGHFVPAEALESALPSTFHGVALDDDTKLPVAFVVKRGVHAWKLGGPGSDADPEKRELLDYHAELALTGRTRTLAGVEFWATTDGRAVRLTDVTLVRERHEFPDFAAGDRKWIDVSIVTGTLVAYVGHKPVYATLVSVGRDRLGSTGPRNADSPPDSTAATVRGEHTVVSKHITFAGHDPATFAEGVAVYDVPWSIELSSGQAIVGAYWHDRFGIEHGPGNLEVSPMDAAHLFAWTDPALPEGWHSVTGRPDTEKPVIVNVRK